MNRDYRRAKGMMLEVLRDVPRINTTRLAEETAYALGHEAWLDDETHWIWELAVVLTPPGYGPV